MKKTFTDFIFYISGGLVYSLGLVFFLTPNNISVGGFTGIATLINSEFNLPIGIGILLLNIPVLIVGFIKIGGQFIIKTGIVTLILSIEIEIIRPFIPKIQIDTLLASIFGGALIGIGIGIIILKGATTGGSDILAKLIMIKYPHITFGRIILSIDLFVIILSGIVYKNIESSLYSLITIFVSTRIMDTIVYGNDKGKIAFIVSNKNEEILKNILTNMSRGATKISCFGGYTSNEKTMIICTFRSFEISKLNQIINSIDKKAFVIISNADKIIGEGFKRI